MPAKDGLTMKCAGWERQPPERDLDHGHSSSPFDRLALRLVGNPETDPPPVSNSRFRSPTPRPCWHNCFRNNPVAVCCCRTIPPAPSSLDRAVAPPLYNDPVAGRRTSTSAGCDSRAHWAKDSCASSTHQTIPTPQGLRLQLRATSQVAEKCGTACVARDVLRARCPRIDAPRAGQESHDQDRQRRE